MTINHVLPSQVRAGSVQTPKGEKDDKAKDGSQGADPKGRSDRVEISPEGRVLSSQSAAGSQDAEAVSEGRLSQIRDRMRDGTYDTPDVAEEVARQIINSGDLEP